MNTSTEAGNLEFVILAELHRLYDRAAGPIFPVERDGETFREALARRFGELRPMLGTLCDRLAEARAEGRV